MCSLSLPPPLCPPQCVPSSLYLSPIFHNILQALKTFLSLISAKLALFQGLYTYSLFKDCPNPTPLPDRLLSLNGPA